MVQHRWAGGIDPWYVELGLARSVVQGGGGGSGSPETPRNFKFGLCTVNDNIQYIPF